MEENIRKLLEEVKDKNPYSRGTLSHGIWEQKMIFELQWEHFDHCDWHYFFKEHDLHEEFERGVTLTDDLMHQPTNKDFVFNLYWSNLFSPERIFLLDQCFYYKGEELDPFNNHRSMLWNYEQCWVRFNLDKNNQSLEDDISFYVENGLSDLCPNDGVAISMKAILLNRYLHWVGCYESLDEFRDWYIKLNYTNIEEILR